MSLRTIGIDPYGRAIRIDEGPSSVNWAGPIRGGLVEGGPGSHELNRLSSLRKKRREAERRVAG